MNTAVESMNEANEALSDWVQKLPVSLVIPGCEIHAQVQEAMKAADREIRRLTEDNERAWRERNRAYAMVKGWEATVFVEGLPMRAVSVDEWGPGEGGHVGVPEITPRKLTELLDELRELRARK
jgi:hypothetical protein